MTRWGVALEHLLLAARELVDRTLKLRPQRRKELEHARPASGWQRRLKDAGRACSSSFRRCRRGCSIRATSSRAASSRCSAVGRALSPAVCCSSTRPTKAWLATCASRTGALTQLRGAGLAMIVIDKYVERLIAIADHHVIVERGRVAWRGSSIELAADPRSAALSRRLDSGRSRLARRDEPGYAGAGAG